MSSPFAYSAANVGILMEHGFAPSSDGLIYELTTKANIQIQVGINPDRREAYYYVCDLNNDDAESILNYCDGVNDAVMRVLYLSKAFSPVIPIWNRNYGKMCIVAFKEKDELLTLRLTF